eukprot:SAG31_NODE_23228_length_508_cov_1.625917_1_plen_57_part_01
MSARTAAEPSPLRERLLDTLVWRLGGTAERTNRRQHLRCPGIKFGTAKYTYIFQKIL